MTVTARQYIALRLYYCDGLSYRQLGKVLSIDGKTAYDLVARGKRRLVRYCVDAEYPHKSVLVEGLLRPSPTSSVSRNVGQVALRREELLDALERRVAQRDAELADIEECMSGDSFSPTRTKRNHHDQWELRYLHKHECQSLPDSAYIQKRRGGGPARYCAGLASCTLNCCGCDHAR